MAREPMLDLRGLRKRYGEVVALDGVDLVVPAGQILVLMGPSGCGKSTLVRCLNRLLEPDAGEIWFEGRNLLSLPPAELVAVRRRIGFVFQQSNLVRRLTARQNVALGLIAAGRPAGEALEAAAAALARVGLEAKADRHPSQLSGGEQQRVGIARALALSPALMLWDEPTAALDPLLVREVLEVMEELVRDGDRTMVVVTHELSFARRAADRVVLLDRGRIVEDGPPERVFTAPASLMGEQYRRLFEGQRERLAGGRGRAGKGISAGGAKAATKSGPARGNAAAPRLGGGRARRA
jgi:polar amino acid transport system ATP-binding protein